MIELRTMSPTTSPTSSPATRDAIARHADHLASCDDCRDARHDADARSRGMLGDGRRRPRRARLRRVVERVLANAETQVPSTSCRRPARRAPPRPRPVGKAAPTASTRRARSRRSPRPRSSRSRSPSRRSAPPQAALARDRRRRRGARRGRHRHLRVHARRRSTSPTNVRDGRRRLDRQARARSSAPPPTRPTASMVNDGDDWRPLRAGRRRSPAGAELRTDERTRASLELADGTHARARSPTTRRVRRRRAAPRPRSTAGRLVADVAHVDNRPATVDDADRRDRRRRHAVRGDRDRHAHRRCRSCAARSCSTTPQRHTRRRPRRRRGHRSSNGALVGQPRRPALAREVAWSELGAPTAEAATRSPPASARCARTSRASRAIATGTSRSRSTTSRSASSGRSRAPRSPRRSATTRDAAARGRLPVPAARPTRRSTRSRSTSDGRLHRRRVRRQGARREDLEGRDRQGDAAASQQHRAERDHLGARPWRDPALLDWKRGGRFELQDLPDPGEGRSARSSSRTRRSSTPRGPWRQYVYPLPHSRDGSTVADQMTVDVEVRGAAARPGPRGRLRPRTPTRRAPTSTR